MSESKNQTEEKKKFPLGIVIVIFALIVVILGAGIASNMNKKSENATPETAKATINKATTTETIEGEDKTASVPDSDNKNSTKISDTSDALDDNNVGDNLDLATVSKPRILGDPNAPVKISEHSSFTCGHCAKFHKTNFKKIKSEYIDTGKAYIVFSDFPLNGFDIKIGAIARCVPENSYFDFVQLLFETQDNWLKEDFIKYVKQNAKLIGTSEERAELCLNNTDLHAAIAEGRDLAHNKHEIGSTPTLVINDKIVTPGLADYEKIKAIIDAELEKVVE